MTLTTAATLCIVIGIFFNALGVIGILRFPDVYTRLHAETKMATFGTIFLAIGVILYAAGLLAETGDRQYLTLATHTMLAVIAVAFTNATGAHAIARAAHKSGQLPDPSVVDRLQEVKKND
ncbi:MAG: cation:proton antiporter [Methanocalculus sp. MSAO_Arc2]|uniref:monovalent cation/H(+) antiporter subunit G n=1 Tax=Methanocalculus sp. MSAO_Arc2 TaxID=2293855 RepID=UPI000FEDEF52|nr:MAG: cation:proton antiporter [Methanocalculus sp. MSAO_Arc2]